jgi:hypothetical protein
VIHEALESGQEPQAWPPPPVNLPALSIEGFRCVQFGDLILNRQGLSSGFAKNATQGFSSLVGIGIQRSPTLRTPDTCKSFDNEQAQNKKGDPTEILTVYQGYQRRISGMDFHNNQEIKLGYSQSSKLFIP